MPINTTTYDLADEVDRLEQRRNEVATEAARVDDDSDRFTQLVQEGTALDSQLGGLRWALSEWGEDSTVSIGGLTKAEHAQVADTSQNDANRVIGGGDNQSIEGVKSVRMAGMGLRDAPTMPDGATFEQRVAFVGDLPVQLSGWVERQVNEHTAVDEGNSKSFGELVKEKRETSQTGE